MSVLSHMPPVQPVTKEMLASVGTRKTLTIPQVCERAGVSRRTVYNWIAASKIQYIRTAGGSVRIFEDTIWRQPVASPEP